MIFTFYSILNWLIGFIQQILPIFLATFFGAFFAFQLQKHHERKKQEEENFSAGKTAQFNIFTQINTLVNIKKNYLDPRREDTSRATTLTPFSIHAKDQLIDFGSLNFMLEGDAATIAILEDMTNHIYGIADDAIENYKKVFSEFKVYLEKRFPKLKPLKAEFDE